MNTGKRAGFTVIEAAISTSLFGAIMGAFMMSMVAPERTRDDVELVDKLNREGLEVLEFARRELSRSGYEDDFPLTFDDDEIGDDYQVFAHDEPHGELERCDVVYRLPADADGDGWPDVEDDGDVVWEDDPRAFVLRPNESGTNDFVRMDADGQALIVARNVESLSYSNPSETNFEIPLDCMRVDLVLSAAADGLPQRIRLSAVVKLRNGDLAP